MELGVAVRVASDLKQGVENVIQQLLEIVNEPLFLVHIVEPWNLQQKCIQVQSALRMLGFPGLQRPELDIRKSVILGTGAHCTCLDEPQDNCVTKPCLQQHCRRCTLHLPGTAVAAQAIVAGAMRPQELTAHSMHEPQEPTAIAE